MPTLTSVPRNTSPTVLSIESSWEQMARSVAPGRFPALGDVALVDLHQRFNQSSTSSAWKDRVLLELLHAAVDGDSLAAHTVVRLFLPKAIKFARSCTALRALTLDDAIATAVSAVWQAARTYPVHRTSSPSANLQLNALGIISGGPASDSELTAEDDYLEARLNREHHEPTPDEDLAEVLAWALETRTLDRDEVRLMVRYYLADERDISSNREAIAHELGLSPAALQKRASRIRLRLIAAVKQHIADVGRW
ncbi:RNA polymerase sigma factor [Clavibacter michiganensis]|uniref:RNA polymerase sigma factor n=1 Tax=Clavibacter michiganensis TaxID=28447 RepID=UPI00292D3FE4|nr:hypothetical protein [Clavibacter michiganensis]